jgi:hypothetical protein
MNREELASAEIDGHVARRYERRDGTAAVTVLLVCGLPGPIGVHPPTACYPGAGYELLAAPATLLLPDGPDGGSAEFRHTVFGKPSAAVPTYLRILWSWSADGCWKAPEDPRLAFAPRGALYKLYVIREMDTPGQRVEDDPSLEFLRSLLPELERALFRNQSLKSSNSTVGVDEPAPDRQRSQAKRLPDESRNTNL